MSRRIPTFFTDRDGLLTGQAARTAWADQVAVCACRSTGDAQHAIDGTAGDMPATWLGCDNCTGTALGRPLVFRLPSQMD